jgi:hypothetical protein
MNDGKVGINDTAPAEALDVTGNINATGVVRLTMFRSLGHKRRPRPT